jgi:osmotically-inducible protein OsmY
MGRRGTAAIVTAALLMLAGCRSGVDRWQDARIEAEVKSQLVAEQDANLTRLGVVSHGAVVRLSGSVPSAEQRARAEVLTRAVTGVKRVINDVQVHPATE